jgi:hypothetical protein
VSKRRAEQKQMRRYFEQGKALHVPGKKLKPNNVVVQPESGDRSESVSLSVTATSARSVDSPHLDETVGDPPPRREQQEQPDVEPGDEMQSSQPPGWIF